MKNDKWVIILKELNSVRQSPDYAMMIELCYNM